MDPEAAEGQTNTAWQGLPLTPTYPFPFQKGFTSVSTPWSGREAQDSGAQNQLLCQHLRQKAVAAGGLC